MGALFITLKNKWGSSSYYYNGTSSPHITIDLQERWRPTFKHENLQMVQMTPWMDLTVRESLWPSLSFNKSFHGQHEEEALQMSHRKGIWGVSPPVLLLFLQVDREGGTHENKRFGQIVPAMHCSLLFINEEGGKGAILPFQGTHSMALVAKRLNEWRWWQATRQL